MTEDEIEVVAEELAKAGGTSWYPGRQRGPLIRVVSDRYRERARLAIAALERYRARQHGIDSQSNDETAQIKTTARAFSNIGSDSIVRIGSIVVYRPPGEQRAYPCKVERIEGNQAYLVPHLRTCTGWVCVENLSPCRE